MIRETSLALGFESLSRTHHFQGLVGVLLVVLTAFFQGELGTLDTCWMIVDRTI